MTTNKKKDKWERLNDLMNRWHNGDKKVPYEVVEQFVYQIAEKYALEQRKQLIKELRKRTLLVPKIDYDSFLSNRIELNHLAAEVARYVRKDDILFLKPVKYDNQ